MSNYDIIIIGAGPAASVQAHCFQKSKTAGSFFSRNSPSSAGDFLPDFDKYTTGWLTRSFRKNCPGYHARPGYDALRETSIPNLFNVGDSVKPPGLYGVGGCAESAMYVTQKIQDAMSR